MGLRAKLTQVLSAGFLFLGAGTAVLAQATTQLNTRDLSEISDKYNAASNEEPENRSSLELTSTQEAPKDPSTTPSPEPTPNSASNGSSAQSYAHGIHMSKKLLKKQLKQGAQQGPARIVINVEHTKCKEILAKPKSLPFLIAWTDGYLSGVTQNTLTDDTYIKDMTKGVISYCRQHPEALYWKYIQTYYNVSGVVQEAP